MISTEVFVHRIASGLCPSAGRRYERLVETGLAVAIEAAAESDDRRKQRIKYAMIGQLRRVKCQTSSS